ncbi:MAG: hypothetical protein GQ564_10685 [Bacteroidales bacterium]|nr:hypothetical protein [Bacteroidales bacterium]
MIIYVFLAHPDDCELWAGGTLLKHVNKGDIVKSFVFYDITKQRKMESIKALDLLGITSFFYPVKTFSAPNIDSFLKDFTIEVPDLIITHWNLDSHIEHRSIFSFSTMLIHHWNRNKMRNKNGAYPILLMCSTYFLLGENIMFHPNIIVDITGVFDKKIKAIMHHKSQKVEVLIKDIESQNSTFGSSIEKRYAEGFIEYPLFGKNKSLERNNLNELIKDM